MQSNGQNAPPLRLLLLEDNAADAELVQAELRRGGVHAECTVVSSRALYEAKLESGLDGIISDFHLPQFGAREALELLQSKGLDIPFVVVSGAIGEETAVELMQLGAVDYILKDRLTRLPQALRRAVEAVVLRREKAATEASLRINSLKNTETLRRQNEQYRQLFEKNPSPMWVFDRKTLRILAANIAASVSYGYSTEEFLGLTLNDLRPAEDWPRLAQAVAREGEGLRHAGIWRHVRKDGSLLWADVSSSPVVFEGIAARMTIIIDVTARIEGEEQVRASEASLALAQRMAHIGSWQHELTSAGEIDQSTLRSSAELYQIYGLDPAAADSQRALFDALHPDDLIAVKAARAKTLLGGGPYDIEHRIVRRDGTIRVVHVRAERVGGNGSGKPDKILGTTQDITERKLAERAVKEADDKYRAIFENASEGIFQTSPEGKILVANPAVAHILGYASSDELIRERGDVSRSNYVNPQRRGQFCEQMERDGGVVTGFESEVYRKDGERIWISENARTVYDPAGAVHCYEGTFEDITERERVQRELRLSEARLRAVFDTEPECVKVVSAKGLLLDVNPAGLRLLEAKSAAEVTGRPVADLVHPEDRNRFQALHDKASNGGTGELQFRMRGLLGTERWVETHSVGLRDGESGPTSVLSVARDITERKVAEEAQRQSDRLFRDLADAMPQIVWASAPDGRVEYFNRRALEYIQSATTEEAEEAWITNLHPDDVARTVERWQHSIATGENYEIEYRIKRASDGSYRWHLGRALPVRDERGAIIRWFGTSTDIDDSMRAQEAIRLQEEQYRLLFQGNPSPMWVYSVETLCFLEVNEIAVLTYGYTREEFLTMTIDDLGPTEDMPRLRVAVAQKIESIVQGEIWRHYLRDGRVRLMEVYTTAITFQGKAARMVMSVDVTERQQAEATVRESEANLANAQRIAHLGSWEWNLQNGDLHWSPEIYRIFGRPESPAGINYEMFMEGVHPLDRMAVQSAVDSALAGHGPYSVNHRVVHVDGTERIVHEEGEVLFNKAGDPIRMRGTVQDVTDQKQVEASLYREQQFLGAVLDNVGDGIVACDANGVLTYFNRRTRELHGMPLAVVPAEEWSEYYDLFQPDAKTRLLMEEVPLVRALAGETVRDAQLVIAPRKGVARTVVCNGQPLLDEKGLKIGAVAVMRDITESKQAEERIRQQAELLDLAHDAIMVRSMDDEILYWNHGAEMLYGWPAHEVIGKKASAFLYSEGFAAIATARTALVERGQWAGECKHVRHDGSAVVVRSRWTLVRDEQGEPKAALIINTDITDQKKIEEQFLRAQRLESIGTLASGVAHDLNNILAPILMSAPLLHGELTPELKDKIISTIEQSAERGAQIVKQVLTFARGVEGERVLIDPTHLLKEMTHIIEQTFPKSIRVTSRYPEDLWLVEGDPTQLHQILLNLSVNARDAMPSGGTLLLAASNFEVDEHYASMMPGGTAGPHVVLCVQDSGEGMAREVVDKIFDPFFTTKEVGKGTGLGLSTVLGLVQSHGGFVSVSSNPGNGTTFKVYLPASSGVAAQREKPADTPEGNGETILVVDDEPSIVAVTKLILESHNYHVLTAEDGPEALAIFAQQMDTIDLVMTDLMMPFMDGVAVIRSMKRMKPTVRLVASTGQGEQTRLAELQALGVTACLPKPYNRAKLLETLRDVLSIDVAATGSAS